MIRNLKRRSRILNFPGMYVLLLVVLAQAVYAQQSSDQAGNDRRETVALVLGGGAAWGAAHIGVLEVLIEHGIEWDMLVGSSAGAIAGSFLADGYDVESLSDEFAEIEFLDVMEPTLDGLGFFETEPIVDYLDERLEHDRIEDLPYPVIITATNVDTGEPAYLVDGPLPLLLAASSAVPVIFNPVEYEELLLTDGGVVNNLPVSAAVDFGADIIIAVNVASSFSFAGRPETRINFVNRIYNITRQAQYDTENVDVYIAPDLTGISGIDFGAYEEMISIGRDAAEEAIPDLLQLLYPGEK